MSYQKGEIATCAAGVGLKVEQLRDAFEQTELPHYLNFSSVEGATAQAFLWDMIQSVPIRKISQLEFEPSAEVGAYLKSIYTGSETYDHFVGFKSKVGDEGFQVATDIGQTNLLREGQYFAITYLVYYRPYSMAQVPLTYAECGNTENQLIFECDRPGIFDSNSGAFYAQPIPALPAPQRAAQSVVTPMGAALGRLNEEGTGPYTGTNEATAEWDNTGNLRTPGKCSNDTDCYTNLNPGTSINLQTRGMYQKCATSGGRRCVMCDNDISTSTCDSASQSFNGTTVAGACYTYNGLCRFYPGDYTAVSSTDPDTFNPPRPANQDGCSPGCSEESCLNGQCVECITDDQCVLYAQGEYTGTCGDNNVCTYTLPAYGRAAAPVEDESGTVIIIACAVAGGICCIGLILVAIFFKMRASRLNEADSTYGVSDTLAKESRAGKEKRFTFSE